MVLGIPISDWTAPALVSLAVLLIYSGFLVPRRTYKEKADECRRWQLAYETSEKARNASDAQTAELLETTKTTHALILALLEASRTVPRQHGGDRHVAS
jgi:hypothetical protein